MTRAPQSSDRKATLAPPRHRLWKFVEHQLPNLSIFLLIVTLFAAVLLPRMLITVPSGKVGVLWKRFGGGTVLDPRQLRDEGLHIILPWDQLFLYDLRLQSAKGSYNAISKDGVSLTATINVRFQIKHDFIAELHQVIGPNYMDLLVRPEIGSRMREVISQYSAEQVYSTARQEIQEKIRDLVQLKLIEKLVERVPFQDQPAKPERIPGQTYSINLDAFNILDTLVLGIELPSPVVNAINRKTEQYYLAEEYRFRVDRERRESERKQIEAYGIRDFQQTVSQGISDSYLRWRGIEATLQLAQSTNTKVVIIGSGRDGMPIILGNVDAQPPSPSSVMSGGDGNGKPTAASPTVPLEKTPAVKLTTPSEQTPTETTSTKSASATNEQHYPIPLSWAELKALLTRILPSANEYSSEGTESARGVQRGSK
jgi:regulator of protease activity HflC (stomatin/prohibitin superfamily)